MVVIKYLKCLMHASSNYFRCAALGVNNYRFNYFPVHYASTHCEAGCKERLIINLLLYLSSAIYVEVCR